MKECEKELKMEGTRIPSGEFREIGSTADSEGAGIVL